MVGHPSFFHCARRFCLQQRRVNHSLSSKSLSSAVVFSLSRVTESRVLASFYYLYMFYLRTRVRFGSNFVVFHLVHHQHPNSTTVQQMTSMIGTLGQDHNALASIVATLVLGSSRASR